MKRIIALLLAAVMIALLCSCSPLDLVRKNAEDAAEDIENAASGLESKPEEEINGEKVSFEYFDLTFPEVWKNNYGYDASNGDLNTPSHKYSVTVYEKGSHLRMSGGGLLFSILLSSDPDYGSFFPNGGVFGEITLDKRYYLCAYYPSDVQFDEQGQETYTALYNTRTEVINSIDSDKYPVKIYHKNGESSYKAKFTKEPQQKITVEATGNGAVLTLTEKSGKSWKSVFTCSAAIGKDGISADYSESVSATPKGEFFILFAFGTNTAKTGLIYKQIYSSDVWVNDPYSEQYNTIRSKNDEYKTWTTCEDIYAQFSSGASNYGIAFDYNGNCESPRTAAINGGSVIFIDGTRDALVPTYGDIAIPAADMEKLLGLLDAQKNPVIEIK